MTPVTAADEVAAIAGKNAPRLVDIVNRLAVARARQDGPGYVVAMADAVNLFGPMLATADLMGRRRMQLLADHAESPAPERAALAAHAVAQLGGLSPTLAPVEARSAILDVLRRDVEYARGFEAVQALYEDRHAFACARSLDVAITERVRNVIASSVAGTGPVDPKAVIAEIGGWTRAYAETVYSTSVATAYSAGMWARLADPDVAQVLPGAKFVSALLSTSRPNHTACHGMIAPSTSSIWEVYSPPLGYACRCGLREISISEARRENLIGSDGKLMTMLPPGFGVTARPDPGFGRGRPDRRIASGSLS